MKSANNEWLISQCTPIDNYLKKEIHSKISFNKLKSIANSKPRKTIIIEYILLAENK